MTSFDNFYSFPHLFSVYILVFEFYYSILLQKYPFGIYSIQSIYEYSVPMLHIASHCWPLSVPLHPPSLSPHLCSSTLSFLLTLSPSLPLSLYYDMHHLVPNRAVYQVPQSSTKGCISSGGQASLCAYVYGMCTALLYDYVQCLP